MCGAFLNCSHLEFSYYHLIFDLVPHRKPAYFCQVGNSQMTNVKCLQNSLVSQFGHCSYVPCLEEQCLKVTENRSEAAGQAGTERRGPCSGQTPTTRLLPLQPEGCQPAGAGLPPTPGRSRELSALGGQRDKNSPRHQALRVPVWTLCLCPCRPTGLMGGTSDSPGKSPAQCRCPVPHSLSN